MRREHTLLITGVLRRVIIAGLLVALAIVTLGVVASSPAWATGVYGIERFETSFAPEPGVAINQAGSHPAAMTVTMTFNHHVYEGLQFGEKGNIYPNADTRNIQVTLPAGVVANPEATSQKCTEAQLEAEFSKTNTCPYGSAVGVLQFETPYFHSEGSRTALYNMVAPPGVPAEFGANVAKQGVIIHIVGGIEPGGGHALTAKVSDITQWRIASVYSATTTLWGSPADPSHNRLRARCANYDEKEKIQAEVDAEFFRREGKLGQLQEVEEKFDCRAPVDTTPLLTLPSSCSGGPLVSRLVAESWPVSVGGVLRPVEAEAVAELPGVSGCGLLSFSPLVSLLPGSGVAEAASGLSFGVAVPHEEAVGGLAEGNLRRVSVVLPAGVVVSPSAANGLGACSPAEIGLEDGLEPSCPASSRVAEAEVVTPLLESPLKGSIYLAEQESVAEPGSTKKALIGAYLVVEGQGALVKLGGTVSIDPSTGQLTATFDQNPDVPFTSVKVNVFGGPRASLMLPSTCGVYTANTELTPWSSVAPVVWPSSFAVDEACVHGFAPAFVAGTEGAQAGAFSPFTLTLSRRDGEQRFSDLEMVLPQGLSAVISSVPLCSNEQAAVGACPEASKIGTVQTAAGPGPDPVNVSGKIYLTTGYNGGAFGEVVEIPAIAGPFNLDENGRPVVVRGAIRVNPYTAQGTVVSDPFPTSLRGIPLDVKAVNVTLDRAGFTFNATNCAAEGIAGSVGSTVGVSAGVSSLYQAANCAGLRFRPVFKASTAATGKANGNGASLDVKLETKQGPQNAGVAAESNIKKVDVSLPYALSARLATLHKACVASTFEADPSNCPAASDVGTAVADTPLLSAPLEGPAVLVSHGNEAFPDLDFVLQGEGVTAVLVGNTFISKAGITSSRFEAVPDVPVTSFELKLPERPLSVLSAIKNLCAPTKTLTVRKRVRERSHGRVRTVTLKTTKTVAEPLLMPTEITAQSGAVVKQSTKIEVTGCSRATTAAAAKRGK